ncbi:MAG: GIY-YIG nuclease family protein [Patescibacteria group bacterium]
MYILKSDKDEKLYIGSTSDLRRRFKEHNAGLVESTKSRKPLKLVYYECYASEDDARHREHNLKLRARALRQLLIRIKKSISL